MSIKYVLKMTTPYISGLFFVLQTVSTDILLNKFRSSSQTFQLLYLFCICIILDFVVYKHRIICHVGLIGILLLVNNISSGEIFAVTSNILDTVKPIMFFWIKDKVHHERVFDTLTNTKDCLYYFPILSTFVNLAFVLHYKLRLYTFSNLIQILCYFIFALSCCIRYIFPSLEESEYTQTKIKYKHLSILGCQQIFIGFLWQFYQIQVDYSSIYKFKNIIHEINSSLFYCSTTILALSNIIFKYDVVYYSLVSPVITILMILFQIINNYKTFFSNNVFITEFGTIYFSCILLIHELQKKLHYVRYSSDYKQLSFSSDLICFFIGRSIFWLFMNCFAINILTLISFFVNLLWLSTVLYTLKYIRKIEKYEICENLINV